MATAKAAEGDLKARAREVARRLLQAYPGARTELRFRTPLQLLVATILSAQCTDERVNAVTPSLFRRYRSAADFAGADLDELEALIRPTGFYHNKAKAIVACCRALVERHGGRVPRDLEALTRLPGVGRKTANVVLGNAFGEQALAVDTHVLRLANRLGLVRSRKPEEVEETLAALFPRDRLTRLGNAMILHGRRVCRARRPRCCDCCLYDLCAWEDKPAC